MGKPLKWSLIGFGSLCGLALIIAIGGYLFVTSKLEAAMEPQPVPKGAKSILTYLEAESPDTQFQPLAPTQSPLQTLTTPTSRPWARWWWPGGDITIEQACNELQSMDRQGIGGVEIQAFNIGLTKIANAQVQARINTVATDAFNEKMRGVFACAEELGLDVYLNHLSGWPAGGPQILFEDGLKSFVSSEINVTGGMPISLALPRPEPGLNATMLAIAGQATDFFKGAFDPSSATFVSAVAMQTLGGTRTSNPLDGTDTLVLNGKTAVVLDDYVADGVLDWEAPEGDWLIVTTWKMPTGEAPTLAAYPTPGHVVDHLDADITRAHYDYAFGPRTVFSGHYGKAFKGFFNDSLEFKSDRLTGKDFLSEFSARRGYDLRPYLPAIYVDSIDNFFFRDVGGIYANPRYDIGLEDARIRADYQRTLSDLIIERFLDTSREWAQTHGLLSRGQSYGMDLDVLRALGANHIPETEQLFAGGLIPFMKMASSAGALYDRPRISAESFVWMHRDYAVAPRQIKAGADVLFTAGVNQIIYHGISYKTSGPGYEDRLGDIAWAAFSGPDGIAGFSDNYASPSPVWQAMGALNPYFSRVQHLLQAGRPDIDVFIYFPWIGFPSYFESLPGVTDDFLYRGLMPGETLNSKGISFSDLFSKIPFLKVPDRPADPRMDWLVQIAPIIHALEKAGLTWAWINDHALQSRSVQPVGASDASLQSLLIAHTDRIDRSTPDALNKLVEAGLTLSFIGEVPTQQPGFHDADAADKEVADMMSALAGGRQVADIDALLARLSAKVRIADQTGPIHRVSRDLGTDGNVHFFTNLSTDHAAARLELNSISGRAYWFDAMTGAIWSAAAPDNQIELVLAPLVSRFLIITDQDLPVSGPPIHVDMAPANADIASTPLTEWQVSAGDADLTVSGALPDLRSEETFKHIVGPITYTNTFSAADPQLRTILAFGRIEGVADIAVNGQDMGQLSLDPFMMDISGALQKGANTLTVQLTPPLRNAYVGRALAGDPFTSQMQQYENDLAPSGLIGAAHILQHRRQNN